MSSLADDIQQQQQQRGVAIKIEQSAKGARVTVHIFGEEDEDVMQRAVKAYVDTRAKLAAEGQVLAPLEGGRA